MHSSRPDLPRGLHVDNPRIRVRVQSHALRERLFSHPVECLFDSVSTLEFLPCAMADHLASAGGMLPDSSQMSALNWLQAGATRSCGTVIEPCNFPEKFPRPTIVIRRYVLGETLIEAYWKSVAWPGQGVFIGEPLATPYRALK